MKKYIIYVFFIIVFIFWYVIFFTQIFDLKYKYIKFKSGIEFKDQKVKWLNYNTELEINGIKYYERDLDSIHK